LFNHYQKAWFWDVSKVLYLLTVLPLKSISLLSQLCSDLKLTNNYDFTPLIGTKTILFLQNKDLVKLPFKTQFKPLNSGYIQMSSYTMKHFEEHYNKYIGFTIYTMASTYLKTFDIYQSF